MKNQQSNIDKKIEELKVKLNKIYDNYYEEIYTILLQILKLRQQQIKGYSVSNLAREKNINLSSHQITYIFNYKYISKKSKKLISQKKIKSSTLLYIIRQNLKFRKPKYQDKAVKMYLNKKISTRGIQKLKYERIFNKKQKSEATNTALTQFVNAYNTLSTLNMLVKDKGYLIKNKPLLLSLKRNAQRLVKNLNKLL